MNNDYNLAVLAANVNFNYNRDEQTLITTSLHVPYGAIYALIGPSGCGKTTLIKCITGQLQPQSGDIYVFGENPGMMPLHHLGYMPQDYSLFNWLTATESLYYFGSLCQIDKKILMVKIDALINSFFGDSIDKDQLVANYSGGEKRRLSLAIAIIHEPKLLILDEPTVGVDPFLQDQIWRQFQYLRTEKETTIIMTTHYTEEARKSDYLGFMRNGRLILEGPTKEVLKLDTNLSNLFLKLAKNDLKENKIEIHESIGQTKLMKLPHQPWNCSLLGWIATLSVIAKRRWIELYRFPGFVLTCLINPFILVGCIFMALDIPKGLNIGLLNEDFNSSSTQLFLNQINKDIINIIDYTDFNQAYSDAKRKKIHCILKVNNGFARQFIDPDPYDIYDSFEDDVDQDAHKMILNCDMYDLIQVKMIETEFTLNCMQLPGLSKSHLSIEPLYGNYSLENFGKGYSTFLPGSMACTTFVFSIIVGFGLKHFERISGTSDRHKLYAVSTITYQIAIVFSDFIILIIQTLICIILAYHVFSLHSEGSTILIMGLLVSLQFFGLNFGIVLSKSKASFYQLNIFLAMYNTLSLIYSGSIAPHESLPEYGKLVAHTFPTKWSFTALQFWMNRGEYLSMIMAIKNILINMLLGTCLFVVSLFFN